MLPAATSVRAQHRGGYYVTPKGNAKRTRLDMRPDDLLLIDDDDKVYDGEGDASSSWITHHAIYKAFPEIGVVIHAHPKLATVIACGGQPMQPLPGCDEEVRPSPLVPRSLIVDSQPFADHIVEVLGREPEKLAKHGNGVMYPYHGVLVAAPDLDNAFDLLERMEFNAAALLFAPDRGVEWAGASLE